MSLRRFVVGPFLTPRHRSRNLHKSLQKRTEQAPLVNNSRPLRNDLANTKSYTQYRFISQGLENTNASDEKSLSNEKMEKASVETSLPVISQAREDRKVSDEKSVSNKMLESALAETSVPVISAVDTEEKIADNNQDSLEPSKLNSNNDINIEAVRENMIRKIDSIVFSPLPGHQPFTDQEKEIARRCLIKYWTKAKFRIPSKPGYTIEQYKKKLRKSLAFILSRNLAQLSQESQYRDIEVIAHMFATVFPQLATNSYLRSVLYTEVAYVWNKRQEYRAVLDRIFSSHIAAHTDDLDIAIDMNYRLAGHIAIACSWECDVERAQILFDYVKRNKIRLTDVGNYYLLEVLLNGESRESFISALDHSEFIVDGHGSKADYGAIPLTHIPKLIGKAVEIDEGQYLMAAMTIFYKSWPYIASQDVSETLFNHHTNKFELRFKVCLQRLISKNHNKFVIEILTKILESDFLRLDSKILIGKDVLRRTVRKHFDKEARNIPQWKYLPQEIMGVLDVLEVNKIDVSHRSLFHISLLLVQGSEVTTANDVVEFFSMHSHTLKINPFSMSLCIVAAKRCEETFGGGSFIALAEDILIRSLSDNISITYSALECFIAFHLRKGTASSDTGVTVVSTSKAKHFGNNPLSPSEHLVKVSDIAQAIRRNKSIILRPPFTEMAMKANNLLGRFEETALLYEDLSRNTHRYMGKGNSSANDDMVYNDDKYIIEHYPYISRKFMLEMAQDAYIALGREDEANALRGLLGEAISRHQIERDDYEGETTTKSCDEEDLVEK